MKRKKLCYSCKLPKIVIKNNVILYQTIETKNLKLVTKAGSHFDTIGLVFKPKTTHFSKGLQSIFNKIQNWLNLNTWVISPYSTVDSEI